MLADYLQIRSEKEDLFEKYIGHDRILVGPWYILPDEFLNFANACGSVPVIGEK